MVSVPLVVKMNACLQIYTEMVRCDWFETGITIVSTYRYIQNRCKLQEAKACGVLFNQIWKLTIQ
jgi:hypothetical protein